MMLALLFVILRNIVRFQVEDQEKIAETVLKKIFVIPFESDWPKMSKLLGVLYRFFFDLSYRPVVMKKLTIIVLEFR